MTLEPNAQSLRPKLIEVALPLEAISAASAAEKGVRDGHPAGLHLWWSRKPLAACRAMLFAQLVDDPSGWPELFPDVAAQAAERTRLFDVIAALVRWESTHDQAVLGAARLEIAHSLARGRVAQGLGGALDAAVLAEVRPGDEEVLAYLAEHGPTVVDPFAGGGSIPLEGQRLGLRVVGADLNPVAVLIGQATVEVPTRFCDKPPASGGDARPWRGSAGLAADIQYYADWLRERAWDRLAAHYPTVAVTDAVAAQRPELGPYVGQQLTVTAWLWSRTVRSPSPAFDEAQVPLCTTYWLSRKASKPVWLEPEVCAAGRTYRFRVCSGTPANSAVIGHGTRQGRGLHRCLLGGDPIPAEYLRTEAAAGRLGMQLKAVVAAGARERVYLPATPELVASARVALPEDVPDTRLPHKALGFRIQRYGLQTHADPFTPRQLLTHITFTDLLAEVHQQVLAAEGRVTNERAPEGPSLEAGGDGPRAYADAIVLYLALCIDKLADLNNALCTWSPDSQSVSHLFGRQAIPMVWDFAEANPFSQSSGSFAVTVRTVIRSVAKLGNGPARRLAVIRQADATRPAAWPCQAVVATDPPYYDNVPYADLSDFFYVWLRRSLKPVMPDLFRTVLVPKENELVADPGRHGGRNRANQFFLSGMTQALAHVRAHAHPDMPAVIYYAFRQAEQNKELATATGWETFLEALVAAGLSVTGTWPVRTEAANRLRAQGSNALASSVAVVCRPRPPDAPSITRGEFQRALMRRLPEALAVLQRGHVAPVDLAQASIGPGMAIFTQYARVVEADGASMTVAAALAAINQGLDQCLSEQEGEFDGASRFAVTWYETHGMEPGLFGTAETLATARAISVQGVVEAGVLEAKGGKVRLLKRAELPDDWDPATDKRLTVWEATQHLIKRLETQGESGAAELLRKLGGVADAARDLCYRLYTLCERKKWAEEAGHYNGLIVAWPEISKLAAQSARGEQKELFV